MIDSHLVQTLRITFLSIGFVLFVAMAVHWVQHVSTTKPKLTPHVIAVSPLSNGSAVSEANGALQAASLASFVQASKPASAKTQQHSNASSVDSLQPVSAAKAQSQAAAHEQTVPSHASRPSAPSKPTLSPQDVQNPTDLIHPKPLPASATHAMRTSHDE